VGWFVSSLNPAGGLKHVSWDIAVFSNFYSLMAQESGAPRPTGVWCMDTLNVGSSLTVQGVAVAGVVAGANSGGSFNVTSDFKVRGNTTKQLLQRVHLLSTTSRSSATTVYSTYAVASLTPVSSVSQIFVRAGLYYFLPADTTAATMIGMHLMRNPMTAATSFNYLTNCSAATASGGMGNVGGWSLAAGFTVNGHVGFEAVDSTGNLDPRQYGIDWNRGGTAPTVPAAIFGGYITIEEWL